MILRHIFKISDDSRMRITTKTVHDRNSELYDSVSGTIACGTEDIHRDPASREKA